MVCLHVGAMENWGLVTYRERLLLVDPKNTSETSKQYVALVVGKFFLGHEIMIVTSILPLLLLLLLLLFLL